MKEEELKEEEEEEEVGIFIRFELKIKNDITNKNKRIP